MGNLANDPAHSRRELSETLEVRVADLLRLPTFAEVKVVAGEAGLDRIVERANVMEVPDIIAWVKPRELLLTTGYPLRDTPDGLAPLVRALDEAGVSALGVKLHRYLDDLPAEMIEAANTAGLPLLLLPDDAAFDDLLHEVVGDVLLRRSSAAARSDAVGRALMSVVLHGGGLDELMASLHDQIGGLTLVTTPDGRVLASAGADEGVFGQSVVFAETERFRSERFARGQHQAGELSVSVVPVMAGRVDHGRLVVIRERASSVPDAVELLERAATVAALAITKTMAVRAVEAKYRGDFVRDVLMRRAGPTDVVVDHFDSLGWDVARPVAVVVAALDPSHEPQDSRNALRIAQERFANAGVSVVTRHDKTAPVVGFAQEVVAIVGVPAQQQSLRTLVDALVHAVSGDGGGGRRSFATGVSRMIDDPSGIAAGYEQARRAVHVGRQLQGTSAVAHFDDLGAFRLLSLIDDASELANFVGEVLGELADEANPEAADMRATLRVLLDTNLNVAETSRRLHFHYNTLRYRITKLERIVGPFVTDPDLQLDLSLALRVMQMRGL
jgi:purine catabolism regulator